MRRLSGGIVLATGALDALGLLFLFLMVVQVTVDVVLRYVFNMPLVGTITYVSVFYMVAIAFLPLATAERHDAHISVEVVTELLPGGLRLALQRLAQLFSMAVFALLAVRTAYEAVTKMGIGSYVIDAGTRIPTWPSYFFLPVGLGLLAIVLASKLFRGASR